MLCTLIQEPFDRKDWIFEVKWDGYRAIAEIDQEKAILYSRNEHSLSETFPQIIEALELLKVESAVLDGEIVALTDLGRQSFQLMQNYKQDKKGNVIFCVFDLLYLNGQDLRNLPLIERKKHLKDLFSKIKKNSPLKYTPFIWEKGISFFKEAERRGLEGIVEKDATSPYRMRRSLEWVKFKTYKRQEVLIGGYTLPEGERKYFGALLLGIYERGIFKYIGKVGTGFSQDTLSFLGKKLKALEQKECPYTPKIQNKSSIRWVKPLLICEVTFTEWTLDHKLRHPVFKGLRTDKAPKEIKKEKVWKTKH